MLYHKKPQNYITEMEVSACIIEHAWEILLLQRHAEHKFWGTWAEPGWKVDPGENDEDAMIREIFEETWIVIKEWEAKKLFKKYFRFDDMNISIVFYHIILDIKPEIILSENEHSDSIWVTPKKALEMNLIEDFDKIVKEVHFS